MALIPKKRRKIIAKNGAFKGKPGGGMKKSKEYKREKENNVFRLGEDWKE